MIIQDHIKDYVCLPGHVNPHYVLCIQPDCKEQTKLICKNVCYPYYHKDHKVIELQVIQDLFYRFRFLETPQVHQQIVHQIEQIRLLQKEVNTLIDGIIDKLYRFYGRNSKRCTELAKSYSEQKQSIDSIQRLSKVLFEIATINEQNITIKLREPEDNSDVEQPLKECIQQLSSFSIGKSDDVQQINQKPEDRVSFYQSHVQTVQTQSEIRCIAVSRNNILATGGEDRYVTLWNVEENNDQIKKHGRLWSTKKHKQSITSVAFSYDCQTLVSGSQDGMIKFWNMETKELLKKIQAHSDQVSCISYHANGKNVLTCSWDKTIKQWDLTDYSMQPFEAHKERIYMAIYSPDCTQFASCGLDIFITVWIGPNTHFLQGFSQRVDCIQYSPNGKYLASCSSIEKLLVVWDIRRREKLWERIVEDPYRLAFSQDSRLLATSYKNIHIFDTQARIPVGDPIIGHKFWIWGLKFSADNRFIISACMDQTIRYYGLPGQ